MAEPFLQQFKMPDGREITSVVMDAEDFDEFADSLRGIIMLNVDNQRAADAQIDAIKAAKTLPMMARGTKTEFAFEKYGIETDLACFIVRGHGTEILRQINDLGRTDNPGMPGPPSQN